MANGLQNKGHANRRPIVCKKSPPSPCPLGELKLETISVLFNVDWTWAVRGLLLILEGEPTGFYKFEARSVNGIVQSHDDVAANIEFTFAVENCVPGSIAMVFVKLTDPDGCEYIQSLSVAIPLNP